MKGLLESPCSCCCSVTKSCPTLCDPSFLWTAACHASLSIRETSPWVCSNLCPLSQWCHPTISYSVALHPLSPPSPLALNFSSIRVSSNESALHLRWPKYQSFSFSISPSNEYSRLISFRIDCFDLLAIQGSLKSLLQHHSSKVSDLQPSAFFTV